MTYSWAMPKTLTQYKRWLSRLVLLDPKIELKVLRAFHKRMERVGFDEQTCQALKLGLDIVESCLSSFRTKRKVELGCVLASRVRQRREKKEAIALPAGYEEVMCKECNGTGANKNETDFCVACKGYCVDLRKVQ